MGRPRTRNKDLPLGMRQIAGRFYVRPVNREMHRIFAIAFPGKKTAPLGDDKDAARKLWVKLFITNVPADTGASGTVGELIERYQRDFLPMVKDSTKAERTRYCATLKKVFGTRRYAENAVEASTGEFLRTPDLTQYLRAEAKRQVYAEDRRLIADGRPVAANREIEFLSRIFKLAKAEWGLTQYNPCHELQYNKESAREEYHDDDAFMKVHQCATPMMQCMMDLAQMNGSRRGMILGMTLADIGEKGLWTTLNKRAPGAKPNASSHPGLTSTARTLVYAKSWTRSSNCAQRSRRPEEGRGLEYGAALLSRKGKAFGISAFNTAFQRARRKAGFKRHEFHFHDIKAKALSDSPDLADAQARGDHTDSRITKTVYRRKPEVVMPLKRVSKKAL